MKKDIVIVGAGYAGVLTAKKLAKKFKKNIDVNITIIDKNPFHTMLTELHEVAANRVDEESIKISLKRIFAKRKVNVKLDTIESIDFEQKLVLGLTEKYSYDYLVIAAGSEPTFFGVSGAKENAFKLWSYNNAVVLREHIHDCFRKASVETNLEKIKSLLSFYVIGAGFTGVEMVGELAEYVPILCDKFEIDRSLVKLFDVDVLSRIVSIFPEKLSEKIEKRLSKMGVGMLLNTDVCSIGKDFIEMKTGEKITHANTCTVIWAAGIESAQITEEAGKTLQSANRGRIKTDSYLRSLDNDSVFVVGDNIFYIPEGEQNVVPQMVENCENSAETAAYNITCAVTGVGKMEPYEPKFHGVMVSIGGRYGVARVGLPNNMFNIPSFLAMFTKHFINIIYYIQVLGWNKVLSYFKHEFFTIRNNRSFVGGHFSNKTPSFLLVPLRIWLGVVWLFEGVMKIVDGWFTSPHLSGFFGGANTWYDKILNGANSITNAAASTVEATTSATVAVTDTVGGAVGQVLINFNFLGLFRIIFISGKDLAHSTINDLAFKIQVPLMNWFVDTLILPNQSIQIAMQIFIVVAEVLIGLALIAGLFTTLSSGGSLILQAMFVCTTGMYLGTFWMIFAGVAVLIGGGRTFGLDYYVMPFLKKQWKKISIIRKLYIYND